MPESASPGRPRHRLAGGRAIVEAGHELSPMFWSITDCVEAFSCGSFQFRGDLFQRRGKPNLFAQTQRDGVWMNVKVGGGCGWLFPLPRFGLAWAVRQPLPYVPRFVHHAIIQSYDKSTAICHLKSIKGAKLVNEGAETAGDMIGDFH